MLLEDLGGQGHNPPVLANPETTMVNTRQVMYLPAQYVAFSLNPARYSLRQVWETLYLAIVDANDLQNCQALLVWLQVASTSTPVVGNENRPGPRVVTMELTAPVADSTLIQHRQKILTQALLAIVQPSNTLEAEISLMAVAVTQNTNDNHQAWEEKAARSVKQKVLLGKNRSP